ncbi:MAG: SufD family Fe-S cluster assembly protein, partial [Burkholderiales bacterium]|nr:SufD family Fe-S cluster assembly protein [Burkholderiales bacterium]
LALRHQPRSAVEAPLLVLEVAAGARCLLVETHEREPAKCQQAIVQNLQIHVVLGAGATLQHLRSVAPEADDQIAHHLHVRIGRDARYEQATLAGGSRYQLHRHVFELQARGATVRSAGLLFAAGNALEQQVRVSHAAPSTTSDVQMLALASGAARAVLNARTRIAAGASDADVRQRLAGIPTGGQPKLVLRPHLEILHDQVQAAHGATWGALPEDEIFYARQRGLDEHTARRLIVAGMTHALLQRCFSDEATLDALGADALLQAAVARHLEPETTHG